MSNFRDALEGVAIDGFCRIHGSNVELLRTLSSTVPNGNLSFGLTAGVGQFVYTSICDRRPNPPLPPPFSGGQCRIQYQVTTSATVEYLNPPRSETGSRTDLLTGPIYGITQRTAPGGADIISIIFLNGSGEVDYFNVSGVSPPAAKHTGYSILSVVPVSGADDCGDPPSIPPLPPPQSGSRQTNDNITWIDADNNTINNTVNIKAGNAYVDIQNNIQIPLNLTIDNGVNINATINASTGGIVITPPGNGLPTGNPGSPSGNTGRNVSTDGVPPISPIPDPPDPPDPRRTIRGAIVTVLNPERCRASQIIQKENPDIFAPNLGFIQFLVRVGNGNTTAWTSDIPIKNVRNLIPCQWDWGAIDVRGTGQPGVEIDITPVYEISTTPPQFST